MGVPALLLYRHSTTNVHHNNRPVIPSQTSPESAICLRTVNHRCSNDHSQLVSYTESALCPSCVRGARMSGDRLADVAREDPEAFRKFATKADPPLRDRLLELLDKVQDG